MDTIVADGWSVSLCPRAKIADVQSTTRAESLMTDARRINWIDWIDWMCQRYVGSYE